MRHSVYQDGVTYEFEITSENDMIRLGHTIAPTLRAGETMGLTGEIGAGKSVLARAIISSLLDEPEEIPSPTFSIVQQYETRAFDILHWDLYRIEDPDQIIELGFELSNTDSVSLVEWSENSKNYWPKSALNIDIKIDGTRRKVLVTDPENMFSERIVTWLP